MKKIFMIAVMAIVALTANAQAGEYYVTPKFGLGYSVLSNAANYNGGIHGNLGVDFEYMLADQFGISAGVDFMYFESDKYNDAKYKYSAISIPVMANIHIGKFGLHAGAKPSFKTSYKWDIADGYWQGNVSDHSANGAESFVFYVPVGMSFRFNSPFVLGLNCDIPCTNWTKNGIKLMPIYATFGWRF